MNAPHDPFGEDAPRPATDHDAAAPSAPDVPSADDASAADSVPTQSIDANIVPPPPHDAAGEPPIDPASAGAPATTSVLPADSVVPPAPTADAPAGPAPVSESGFPVPPVVPPATTNDSSSKGGSGRGGRIGKAVGVGVLVAAIAVGAGYGGAALQNRGDDGTTVPDGTSALDVPASDEEAP